MFYTFNPILKSTLWGGAKIIPFKQLDCSQNQVGESWEISDVPGDESVVSDGPDKGMNLSQLVRTYRADLVGRENYERFGDCFPLLVKFIDAKQDLSIQVHPNDDLARHRHNSMGKTEMWYVIDNNNGKAHLRSGLNRRITPEEYTQMIASDTICDALTNYPLQNGDVFFLPAGRIHSIGKGCFIAEIQQTSNITYRIYDWDRIDVAGMRRELHIPQSLEALDFNLPEQYKIDVPNEMNRSLPVVDSQFFVTNMLQMEGGEMEKDYSSLDSFVILLCTKGKFELKWENGTECVNAGECILVPNVINQVTIRAEQYCKLMEVYINVE